MSTPPRPRVSLVMPNLNNEVILDETLDKLARHTTYPDFELVVVDDGSVDGSREILRRWRDSGRFADFKLIERENSGAVADALNTGLEAATGELAAQLDADATIETPGWLERMVDLLVSDERVGVVTAKVVYDIGTVNACGLNLIAPEGLHDRGTRISERVGKRTYHHRVMRPQEAGCGLCQTTAEVDGGLGCCMIYRRDLALEAGGYDRGFAPVWFDDLDLTLGIRRLGYKVFFLPDVRVIHRPGLRRGETPTTRQRFVGQLRKARGLLPLRARGWLVQAFDLDRPTEEHRERLAHHYAYWRRKWGFDILNPDMQAVLDRWGDTEICWRHNPEMLEAGRRIVAAYESRAQAA